jgi:hypothetical protein
LQIELSRQERKQIEKLLSGGVQPVRTVIRALVLRQMDEGRTTVEAGAGVGMSAKVVWEIGKRYLEGGLKRAIYGAPRPGQKPLLDAEHGQRIIAMVCGPPPETALLNHAGAVLEAGFIHLFGGREIQSGNPPPGILHRAGTGCDGKPAFLDFDKIDAVAGLQA